MAYDTQHSLYSNKHKRLAAYLAHLLRHASKAVQPVERCRIQAVLSISSSERLIDGHPTLNIDSPKLHAAYQKVSLKPSRDMLAAPQVRLHWLTRSAMLETFMPADTGIELVELKLNQAA